MNQISINNKITLAVLFFFAFGFLLYTSEAIQSILMGITGLIMLFYYKSWKDLLTHYTLPFLICFVCLLSINLFYFHPKSIQIITNSLLIFIIPLFSFYLYQSPWFLNKKTIIMGTYCISILLLTLYVIGFYILDYPNHHFNWYFARFNLENNMHIHGTYLSLWIGVAFLMAVNYFLTKEHRKTVKYSLLTALLIYLLGLLIVNSRTTISSILFLTCFRFYFHYYKKNKTLFIVSILILVAASLFISQRYQDDLNYFYQNNITNSTRYTLCYCSIETAADSNFLGTDNGLIQSKLNTCYTKYGFTNFSKENLNSHNQYLDFLLKGGFLLFVSFIWMIYNKLRYTSKTENYLYFTITLLFVFAFCTENILVRQYGIYVYLFCDILLLGSILPNKSHCTDKIKEC
ncbi:O-antigen ligase family protein [Flavobacterium aestuarii]|uniref:O-antigen ligase family protein n=1 Tax=Flavobacterium aestuarii TaxID=3149227 RepID=UPI0032B43448